MSDTTDDLEGSAWADPLPTPIEVSQAIRSTDDPFEGDVRARMAVDMTTVLTEHGISVADIEDVVGCLVDAGMHQVYRAWEEGRP